MPGPNDRYVLVGGMPVTAVGCGHGGYRGKYERDGGCAVSLRVDNTGRSCVGLPWQELLAIAARNWQLQPGG